MIPLSATQINMAQTCLRQWAFRYLTDLSKPPTDPSMDLGIRLHKVAEDYLKIGTAPIPDTLEGEIFMKGMQYLPAPGKGVVEGKTHIEIGGIKYVLIVDCLIRGTNLPNWELGSMPVAIDHKTSSNPTKHGLTQETILTDVQAILYAYYLIAKYDVSRVGLRWLYYKTKGRGLSYPVDVAPTNKVIFSNFQEIIQPISNQLVTLWQEKPDPNTLPCDPTACYKYNKTCHYKDHCIISIEDRSSAYSKKYLTKGDSDMAVPSIKEKMAMKQAQQGQIGATQPGNGINPPVPGRTVPPSGQAQQMASPPQPPPPPPGQAQQMASPPLPPPPGQAQQAQAPTRDELMRQASVGNVQVKEDDTALKDLLRGIRDALNAYLG